MAEEIRINVPADAGTSMYWGEWMVLAQPPQNGAVESLVLNLADLRSADPLFLARMRAFIDWHCSIGREIRILAPRAQSMRIYSR